MNRVVSDERLSRRLASGEAAAFDELYRRYAHRLSAYASSLLGDRAAGEDVAQVALLNAYQALRRGRVPERVRPWLFRIAHNEAVDLLARRRELLQGIDLDDRPAPADGVEVRGALLAALAKLPDRQRRAYLLREVHGLRIAEIAAELSLAVPHVEQALFAARNRLAEELVFGDGLTCDAAQRLTEGPLAAVERRALRRHFRTCAHCRAAGVRLAPGVSFEWLRGRLVDLLVGGAAPAAAKVGAVVAASVATGAAVGPAMLAHEPHAHAPGVAIAAAAGAVPAAETLPKPVLASVASAPPEQRPQLPQSRPVRHEAEHARSGSDGGRRGEDGGHEAARRETTTSDSGHGDGGGDVLAEARQAEPTLMTSESHGGSGDGGVEQRHELTTTTTATTATTTTTSSGRDGGGDSGRDSSGGDSLSSGSGG